MADDKEKHTPESVAAKVVKALLKVKPTKKLKEQTKGRSKQKQHL